MEKKTAYLISCSDHYGHRLHVADACLRSRGYETTYITSNFDHTSKAVFTCHVDGCVQIPARPYRKNLSLDRILNHWQFARDVFRYLESLPKQPDMLVVLLPPNFLAYYTAKYKKRHPDVKLVFDIFDLWPETFPGEKAKKLLAPAFAVWAAIRDLNLGKADFVVTECEMFRQRLGLDSKKSATVYLCAKPVQIDPSPVELRSDGLDLCYLGAINNVIDIPSICELIAKLAKEKPVTLHIIGKGEKQQEFVDTAQAAGAQVEFYGPVYDDEKKWDIMRKCHFGLNIMKSSVCVGLTMKSVDYFRFGLPIINNIPADTAGFVQQDKIGLQFEDDCAMKLAAISVEECMQIRENVNRVFRDRFDETVVKNKYADVLQSIL